MAKKQSEIAGTERPSHPEVDELAEQYRDLRDKRMALGIKEEAARVLLENKMRSLGMKPDADALTKQVAYRYQEGDQLMEVLWSPPKCKVRKVRNGADDSAEAAE